jgi:hypothetical protein
MTRYSRAAWLQSTHCTVAGPNGTFCDAVSLEDGPFPICAHHAIKLYRWMNDMVTEVKSDHRKYADVFADAVEHVRDANHARANTVTHKVYYVRVGDLIKIGMTRNLRTRIASYPPGSELLATERGGEALEAQRLRQFRHLLAQRNEWFHPGEDLMAHIATLKAA